MDSEVKVQVVCVTYNQKDYIKDALDSFIIQKTNFKFQVLVGDDCSTDGTSEIVSEYARKYPDIIVHIRREQNLGCLKNFIDLCEQANAKYVAFCDGDDFWTNENKLQIQFDFMEKNEDVNICAHKVGVKIDKEDSLFNYYKDFNFTVPLDIPCLKKVTIKEIAHNLPQTSSIFARWKKINYQKFASEGVAGDFITVCLLLGDKRAVIFKETMSCYRKNSTGVFFNEDNIYKHYLKTRPDYFRFLPIIIDYFKHHYNSFGVNSLEKRLLIEMNNYMNAIIETDQWGELLTVKEKYPNVYKQIKEMLSEYNVKLKQNNKLGEGQADLLKKSGTLMLIKPILFLIYYLKKIPKQMLFSIKGFHSFLAYWAFALVPKKKNLWVFSGFFKSNYMDNTKYLYEYIVKNHPEIDVVWLTKNKNVLKQLQQEKMPVLKMKSLKGVWTMARAQVAFSDHFKMSDYDNRFGFNAKTKFINIFHGFGPKGMKPVGDTIPNTTIPGVRLSSDIIINENDSLSAKIIKSLKYPFIAPFRELFEKYFAMVCPGTPCNDFFATPWRVKEDAQLKCGYPRSVDLYNKKTPRSASKIKILYAPTYRWNVKDEENMIKTLLEKVPSLNQAMEKINGEFIFRMHPHTWRNYESSIIKKIKNYTHFSISTEKDIYKTLSDYSIMITDYSSIGWEYLITQNPIIYFAFDIDTYNSSDCPFDMDYEKICAGDIVKTWDEVINSIYEYSNTPDKDIERRKHVLELFFPSEYNDANNSVRLVNIIKGKLGL